MLVITTKTKDILLLVILYLLIGLAYFYGWTSLGMRWEFLAGLVVFIWVVSIQRIDEGLFYRIISKIETLLIVIIGTVVGTVVGTVSQEFLIVPSVFVSVGLGLLVAKEILVGKKTWDELYEIGFLAGMLSGGIVGGILVGVVVHGGFFAVLGKLIIGSIIGSIIGWITGGITGWITVEILAWIMFIIQLLTESFIGSFIRGIIVVFVRTSKTIITKIYDEDESFWIKLPPYLLFPPFIFLFLNVFLSQFELLTKWHISYIVTGITAYFLSLFFAYLSNLIFLFFRHASRKEKLIQHYLFAYPHIFCKRHLLRPIKVRNALFYNDILCRIDENCPKKFTTGIKQVIGLIGGKISNYMRVDDKFYINLWDNEKKKSRRADIDVLEIRNTEGINYDLAITSVYDTLVNDISRPRDWLKNISVVIKGNPFISEDVMKVLQENFGEVEKL